jgi:hypothetical protein
MNDQGMSALARAGLVGAVVGLAEALVYVLTRGEAPAPIIGLAMFVLSFPLGMFLCWFGRLPVRWGVATLGSFVFFAVLLLNVVYLPFSDVMDLGFGVRSLAFMAMGVIAYAVAAALVVPMRLALRLWTVGVAVAAMLAGWAVPQGVISAAVLAERMEDAGVPLVAPDIPGHRLIEVSDVDEVLKLSYVGEGTGIEVTVQPANAMTPRQLCREHGRYGRCRKVSAHVWAGFDDLQGNAVYARQAGALVAVTGSSASEADLLRTIPTFRPLTLTELRELTAIG